MKLEVKLETKTLTNINSKMFDKVCVKFNPRLLKARHKIYFYLQDKQQRYYIYTGFHTSNTRMCGCNFHDSEFSLIENAELTTALKDLYAQCNNFIDEHWEWDIISIKDGIRAILGADTPEEAKESSDNIRRHEVLKYMDEVVIPTKGIGTSRIYNDTRSYLVRYTEYNRHKPIYVEDMGVKWLKGFHNWMLSLHKQKGGPLSDSTIQIHLRGIRNVINFAKEEGIISDYPFGRTNAKFNMPKVKRKHHLILTMQEFADFRDYPVQEAHQRWKDLALLTFYLNGINLADILTIADTYKGRIVFDRKKTGVDSSFIIHPEAQQILDKYQGKGQLLNFLDTYQSVNAVTKEANKRLKQIGYMYIGKDKVGKRRKHCYLPMFPDMTIYTFRRSLSTFLADIDCPTEIINMALSHANLSPYATTEIYIRRDSKKLDTWTRKLFDELAKVKGRPKEEIDKELKQRYGIV